MPPATSTEARAVVLFLEVGHDRGPDAGLRLLAQFLSTYDVADR
ncbi:hypothetical protein [Streptomyces sp. NPDC055912]